jgi:hypothetical protein
MRAVRALQRRMVKLEHASLPRPSPFAKMFGSFDAYVEQLVIPGIEAGMLDKTDMVDVVTALRRWEGGTWSRAFED